MAESVPVSYTHLDVYKRQAKWNGKEITPKSITEGLTPGIKKAIMINELAFMLKRPSDDSNNSTLASVKPCLLYTSIGLVL